MIQRGNYWTYIAQDLAQYSSSKLEVQMLLVSCQIMGTRPSEPATIDSKELKAVKQPKGDLEMIRQVCLQHHVMNQSEGNNSSYLWSANILRELPAGSAICRSGQTSNGEDEDTSQNWRFENKQQAISLAKVLFLSI